MSLDEWANDIHQGDAVETLRRMPSASVHCVVTSPPYYGQRNYEVEGQIGLEESPQEYIASIVAVARELQRVIRPDGSWWLNLGDTYSGGSIVRSDGNWTSPGDEGYEEAHTATVDTDGRRSISDFGPKNKMLLPHRIAIALQDAGWVVRSDVPWIKDMPDPASDRVRRGPEYVFHLTRRPDYWHDPRELDHPGWLDFSQGQFPDAHFATFPKELPKLPIRATAPPNVCKVCGTPRVPTFVESAIPDDDRPQTKRAIRLAERSGLTDEHLEACRAVGFSDAGAGKKTQTGGGNNTDRVEALAAEAKDVLGGYFREFTGSHRKFDGWEARCDCDGDDSIGVVLDPFAGSGTTCRVARDLGRRYIGIELKPEYVAMAQARVGVTVDRPELLTDDQQATLADGGFIKLVDSGKEGDS